MDHVPRLIAITKWYPIEQIVHQFGPCVHFPPSIQWLKISIQCSNISNEARNPLRAPYVLRCMFRVEGFSTSSGWWLGVCHGGLATGLCKLSAEWNWPRENTTDITGFHKWGITKMVGLFHGKSWKIPLKWRMIWGYPYDSGNLHIAGICYGYTVKIHVNILFFSLDILHFLCQCIFVDALGEASVLDSGEIGCVRVPWDPRPLGMFMIATEWGHAQQFRGNHGDFKWWFIHYRIGDLANAIWFNQQITVNALVQEIEYSVGFDSSIIWPMICVPSIMSERDGFCVKKGFHRHPKCDVLSMFVTTFPV